MAIWEISANIVGVAVARDIYIRTIVMACGVVGIPNLAGVAIVTGEANVTVTHTTPVDHGNVFTLAMAAHCCVRASVSAVWELFIPGGTHVTSTSVETTFAFTGANPIRARHANALTVTAHKRVTAVVYANGIPRISERARVAVASIVAGEHSRQR